MDRWSDPCIFGPLPQVRDIADIEPVFYHTLPIEVDEEIMHSYDITSVIELTAGPGNCALTCIRQRKPYFGITLTDDHSELLNSWLVHQTWLSFLDFFS